MKNPGFAAQPRHEEPIAGRDGRISQAWANYFARLATVQTGDDLRQLYEALASRVAELAEGQALRIIGRNSVNSAGTSVVEIQLVGDDLTPGNTEYYGTGPDGAKGFFPVADAIEVEAAELDKVVGADGVITLGLADVPDAGGGTLQKTAFDAKGRKTGTSAATTDDLSEGAGNLYYTDARADARAAVAVAAHVAQADPHTQYQMKLPAGTTGQFLRGDGTFSNELEASGDQRLVMRAASDTLVPNYTGHRARGTLALPTAVASTDTLMLFVAGGWNGTEYKISARVRMRAEEAYTGSASGSGLLFEATPIGANAAVVRGRYDGNGHFLPGADNAQNLGAASSRYKEVFAGNSVINTSDAREKTPVRPLNAAEITAAMELGSEIGVYRWFAMIEAKGASAREHIGMTVQRAIAVLESHGLDPFRYGFICYDQWDELPEVLDEDGDVVQAYRPADDRYSFRMDELLAFIAAGERAARIAANAELHALIVAMEQRLAAAGL